ncbi:hypothetical protein AVEN_99186-1 [Araneus ventricosus]|uniref:Uncharacterized protein n=1 Tax=Araneus ventricosus TaxID=182803 RepID=A0A4Y2CJ84_ARAVE|nr:hypothetical protein AVEN_99186-1 [Araneus ventricosus]
MGRVMPYGQCILDKRFRLSKKNCRSNEVRKAINRSGVSRELPLLNDIQRPRVHFPKGVRIAFKLKCLGSVIGFEHVQYQGRKTAAGNLVFALRKWFAKY